MLRRRKHGTTGRLALPHQFVRMEEMLRPSVQLPAGICGCAGYTGFAGLGKGEAAEDRTRKRQIAPSLQIKVQLAIGVRPGRVGWRRISIERWD